MSDLIEKYIPHRGKMKLIKSIVSIDSIRVISSSIVTDEYPFFRNGTVDPVILIELAAQTTSLAQGWTRSRILKLHPHRGWVG